MASNIRNSLIIFSFLLLSITIIGIFWLITTPGAQAGLIFAYAAGLSMIFCRHYLWRLLLWHWQWIPLGTRFLMRWTLNLCLLAVSVGYLWFSDGSW